MCLCVCVHISVGAHGGQKRMQDSLDLEFQVSPLMGVLGTKLRSSARAVGTLNHQACSQNHR